MSFILPCACMPLTSMGSHVWLFEGAEGGKWVDEVERKSLGQEAIAAEFIDSDSEGDEDDQPDEKPQVKRPRTA